MTREEIVTQYTVNGQGIITSPGKFEGQMIFAPYFYNASLEYEPNADGDIEVPVEPSDVIRFPELLDETGECEGPPTYVLVYEDENSFVDCAPVWGPFSETEA